MVLDKNLRGFLAAALTIGVWAVCSQILHCPPEVGLAAAGLVVTVVDLAPWPASRGQMLTTFVYLVLIAIIAAAQPFGIGLLATFVMAWLLYVSIYRALRPPPEPVASTV